MRASWSVYLVFILVGGCGGSTTSEAKAPPPPPTPAPATAQAEPPAVGPETSVAEGCPAGMAEVPGGTLWLGSPESQGEPDEHPQKAVDVPTFCLGTHEVTVAEFQECVDNGVCDAVPKEVQRLKPLKPEQHEALSAACTGAQERAGELPLNCVPSAVAEKYCSWKGQRLPTEKEWEYAATSGEDKLPYPWGMDEPSDERVCWKADGPCKADAHPAGAYGIHDLAGNLREWTGTRYAPYESGAEAGEDLVVRGGSFQSKKASEVSPKRRAKRPAVYADIDLGFRCAKDR